jgi:hypothetical protein
MFVYREEIKGMGNWWQCINLNAHWLDLKEGKEERDKLVGRSKGIQRVGWEGFTRIRGSAVFRRVKGVGRVRFLPVRFLVG